MAEQIEETHGDLPCQEPGLMLLKTETFFRYRYLRMKPLSLQWPGIRGPVYADFPLGPLTTWKIGGPAQYLAIPQDVEDVYRLLGLAQERGWPVFFLGRGSNVLIDDAGLPGLTIHLPKSLQKLAVGGEDVGWAVPTIQKISKLATQGGLIRAGAGVTLPRLAQTAARLGFSGFEFLAGIPGTVGAAVRLNAGAFGEYLGGALRQVWVVTPQLQLRELPAHELGLGYRSSLLLRFPHWLVVEAEFALTTPASPEAVQARMGELLTWRRTRHPANPRSCGSVFKNPPNAPPAGLLIDQAGLKGRRAGDAQVSRKHANFILNQGRAAAAQVKALITAIQETVQRTHGLTLEREVVFLPDDLR